MSKPMMIFMPKLQFFNGSTPLSGGQVFIYQPGTTTKQNTYTDSTLVTTNPNPVILNVNGQPANNGAPIDMYTTGAYKMVLALPGDTDPPTNPIWTEDNITTLGQLVSVMKTTISYSVQLTDRDKLILADASLGNLVITLPASSNAGNGFNIKIKKIDGTSNTVTIQANGAELIDTTNTIVTATPDSYVGLFNDGTQWWRDVQAALYPADTISANPTGSVALLQPVTLAANLAFSGTVLGLAAIGANTKLANATGSSAVPTAVALTNAVTSINTQTFTSSGTYTPTAGMTYCIIECLGGGGAGGGAVVSSGQSFGGGGGAGGYSKHLANATAISTSQVVTVGAAGAPGAAGANPGGNGGNSSVGTICIAHGGTGGGQSGANAQSLGGVGGTAGTGNVCTYVGNAGDNGQSSSATTVSLTSGAGAGSIVGGRPLAAQFSGGTGPSANNYGSGGSGGSSSSSSAAATGGSGSAGYVIITEFIGTLV